MNWIPINPANPPEDRVLALFEYDGTELIVPGTVLVDRTGTKKGRVCLLTDDFDIKESPQYYIPFSTLYNLKRGL